MLRSTLILSIGLLAAAPRAQAWALDPQHYAALYPDVTKALGTDPGTLLHHYWKHGRFEGRSPNRYFDPGTYRATYPDLDRAFGDRWVSYLEHWMGAGMREGRRGSAGFHITADYVAGLTDETRAALGLVNWTPQRSTTTGYQYAAAWLHYTRNKALEPSPVTGGWPDLSRHPVMVVGQRTFVLDYGYIGDHKHENARVTIPAGWRFVDHSERRTTRGGPNGNSGYRIHTSRPPVQWVEARLRRFYPGPFKGRVWLGIELTVEIAPIAGPPGG